MVRYLPRLDHYRSNLTMAVFLSSTSDTALDAIKLGDFGLGVILFQGSDPSTYAGTRSYMPPVSHYFSAQLIASVY